jgi:hypothetical protein
MKRSRLPERLGKSAAFLALLSGCGDRLGSASQSSNVAQASTPLIANAIVHPSRWVAGYGTSTLWLDNDKHPRMMADVDGDGQDDIVGFGNGAVCVSFSKGSYFTPECDTNGGSAVLPGEYGYAKEGGLWTSNTVYPRMMADVNGDHKADIVGFGSVGVYVSLWNPTTHTFDSCPAPWLLEYGTKILPSGAGGWDDNIKFPRMMADVNGDNKADIVGFGNAGVVLALSNGHGFDPPRLVLPAFGVAQNWVDNIKHPRMMADVNGDHKADIVGCGPDGVWVSLSNGVGFNPPQYKLAQYGSDLSAGGWEDNIRYPRTLANVDGQYGPDIVGFGGGGVSVSLSTSAGGFRPHGEAWPHEFGSLPAAGGWEEKPSGATRAGDPYTYVLTSGESRTGYKPKYPRMMADVNGDGLDDIVGFANAGVLVSASTGSGFNSSVSLLSTDYGYTRDFTQCAPAPIYGWDQDGYPKCRAAVSPATDGWRSNEHPRMTAVVKDDNPYDNIRKAEVVGFGNDGVIVTHTADMQPICGVVAAVDQSKLIEYATMVVGDGKPRNSCVQTGCGEAASFGSPCVTDDSRLNGVATRLKATYRGLGYREDNSQTKLAVEQVGMCGRYNNGQPIWYHDNVIATKVGAVHPDTFIEVDAHMDSHPHAPGAVDNASGTAAVLEIARLISSRPTRHSIRFINYVGHESLWNESGCGNEGSVQHIRDVLYPGRDGRPTTYAGQTIMASLNVDGIGWTDAPLGTYQNVVVFAQLARSDRLGDLFKNSGPPSARIADLFKAVLSPCNIGMGWKKAAWPGGDHGSYAGFDLVADRIEDILAKGAIPSVASVGGLPFDPGHTTGYHDCGDTLDKMNWGNILRTTQQNLAVLLALDLLDGSP